MMDSVAHRPIAAAGHSGWLLALTLVGGVAAWIMVRAAKLPTRYLGWYVAAALIPPSAIGLFAVLVAVPMLFSHAPNWGALLEGVVLLGPVVSVVRLAPFVVLAFIGLKCFGARGGVRP